jgi:transposase
MSTTLNASIDEFLAWMRTADDTDAPVLEEPPIHPAIEATSTRQQTSAYRRAGRQFSDVQCARIFTFIELGWKPSAIAKKLHISTRTVEKMQQNLLIYGSMRKPQLLARGRPHKMTLADEDALLDYLIAFGWRTQDEMAYWLEQERDLAVDRSTISKLLKRRKWNQKELRRISMTRSVDSRTAYRRDISQFDDKDLVFLDESIFNEKTGWRHRAYAPVGHLARYTMDLKRGKTWAIIAAMTLDGWLPCTEMKEGYFKTADFIAWIDSKLIPTLRERFEGRTAIIIMDNCSIHKNPAIEDRLVASGFLVRYLPPYSPDYNPIELSFSVLKSWMRRNWMIHRGLFNSFGDWLNHAIQTSHCDRFAKEQFRHAADGIYCDGDKARKFYQFLEKWERGEVQDNP